MHLTIDSANSRGHGCLLEDPLGHDQADDAVVTTTRRALSRIAFVAAETASRFEREAIEHDPVAWLFAPRDLFHGEAAIDACLKRDAFQRAVLLHGLSLGLDAEPDVLDDLLSDEDDLEGEPPLWSWEKRTEEGDRLCGSGIRLFSATIDHQDGGKVQHGFHASTASSMSEFRSRVVEIFGADALPHALLREGLNPEVGMVADLVAPELMHTLTTARVYSGRRVAVTAQRVVELDS